MTFFLFCCLTQQERQEELWYSRKESNTVSHLISSALNWNYIFENTLKFKCLSLYWDSILCAFSDKLLFLEKYVCVYHIWILLSCFVVLMIESRVCYTLPLICIPRLFILFCLYFNVYPAMMPRHTLNILFCLSLHIFITSYFNKHWWLLIRGSKSIDLKLLIA